MAYFILIKHTVFVLVTIFQGVNSDKFHEFQSCSKNTDSDTINDTSTMSFSCYAN